jgi:hypothetical protein
VRFTCAVGVWETSRASAFVDGFEVRSDRFVPPGEYARGDLAAKWSGLAGSGLDMKDYVFARDLSDIAWDADGFTVRSGRLDDPYTGEPIQFTQAVDSSDWLIEIDHAVSLKDAWLSGAHRWSPRGRNWTRFYNFGANLVPTARPVNRQKGAKNAAEWLPPNLDFSFDSSCFPGLVWGFGARHVDGERSVT